MINIIDAILALNPTALVKVTSEDYSKIEWLHGTEPISVNDIKKKFNELQAEYDANQYQRDRQYPSIGDQLDMQYHDQLDGTTTWKDAIKKVKDDNPKPKE